MKKLYSFLFAVFVLVLASPRLEAQISLASLSDFQNGTNQGWGVGSMGASQPVNMATGGPNGPGDRYLSTNNLVGTGGKLVINNESPIWTGDWLAAGVNFISFMARNPGPNPLTLRAVFKLFQGPGAPAAFSAIGVVLPAGSGWTRINLPVQPFDLLDNGFPVPFILSGVVQLRIIHNTMPSGEGEPIVGALDIDVISASAGLILPVTLEYFNASSDNNNNTISWKTLSESNSDYFEVERSADGSNWTLLEKINAAGNSIAAIEYSVKDFFPYKGFSYYRLKQVDIDNRFTYSAVRKVLVNEAIDNSITVYPNPATAFIILAEKNTVDIAALIITNISGQVVNNRVKINSLSPYKIRIDISQLADGIYYIKTKNGNMVQYIKK